MKKRSQYLLLGSLVILVSTNIYISFRQLARDEQKQKERTELIIKQTADQAVKSTISIDREQYK